MTVAFDKEKFYKKLMDEKQKEDVEEFNEQKSKKSTQNVQTNKNKPVEDKNKKKIDDGTYSYKPFEAFFKKKEEENKSE